MAAYDDEDQKLGQGAGQYDRSAPLEASSQKQTPEQLRDAEENGEQPSASAAEGKESSSVNDAKDQIGTGYNDKDNSGLSKFNPLKNSKSGLVAKLKQRKKLVVLLGGGGGVGIFIFLFVFLIFISSLKSVHFATVLQNAGFLTFQTTLRQRLNQDLFDSAVLSPESTGSLQLAGRSLTDRLRGINPEAQLKVLGNEGKVQFDIEGGKDWLGRSTNEFKGVTIGDKAITLDGLVKENHLGESWSDLTGLNALKNPLASARQRLAVRKQFVDNVKVAVTDGLEIEKRTVRNSVYDGIRQASDIPFSRWRQAARSWLGLKPDEALKKAEVESVDDAMGKTPPIETESDIVNKTTDGATDTIKTAINDAPPGESIDPGAALVASATKKVNPFSSLASNVSLGVLITTVGCMFNATFKKVDQATANNTEEAKRMGHQALTTASQIKSGDVVSEAVAADSKRWDGADLSPEYQNDVNAKNVTIPDGYSVPSLGPKISPGTLDLLTKLTSPSSYVTFGYKIPGVSDAIDSTVCSTVTSLPGQAGIALVESAIQVIGDGAGGAATEGEVAGQAGLRAFVSDLAQQLGEDAIGTFKSVAVKLGQNAKGAVSVKGAKGFAGFAVLNTALQVASSLVSGTNYSGADTSAPLYSKSRVGVDTLAQENNRQGLYGRPLAPKETVALDSSAKTEDMQQYAQTSWTNRYFAISSPYSLAGRIAALLPTSFVGFFSSIQSSFSSLGSVLSPFKLANQGGILAAVGGANKVSAASASKYDFHHGVLQWDYSTDEQNKMKNDSSYGLAENETILTTKYNLADLDAKYSKCFTPKKESDLGSDLISSDGQDGPCGAKALSTEEALRYRIYRGVDSYVVGELSQDYTHPTTTPTAPPATPTTPGAIIDPNTLHDSSANIACAAGTNDLGVGDGYAGGNLVKIRLCGLPNLPSNGDESTPGNANYVNGANGDAVVNSRVSGQWLALVAAAKAAGIDVKASSSFRTMAHQQKLCSGNAQCSAGNNTAVAKPGYSNHQMGLAIDFYDGNNFEISNCKGAHESNGRCISPDNATWNWLNKNAAQFGFSQYVNESWHWSPDGK